SLPTKISPNASHQDSWNGSSIRTRRFHAGLPPQKNGPSISQRICAPKCLGSADEQSLLKVSQVFLSIHTNAVVWRLGDVNWNSALEESQLLQALDALQ